MFFNKYLLDRIRRCISADRFTTLSFNPCTTIEFAIPKTGFVILTIYDIRGEKVATLVSENLAAGSYRYPWDAGDLASGVYFYRLETDHGFNQTRKMLLIR